MILDNQATGKMLFNLSQVLFPVKKKIEFELELVSQQK
jgi:hypothetical protein